MTIARNVILPSISNLPPNVQDQPNAPADLLLPSGRWAFRLNPQVRCCVAKNPVKQERVIRTETQDLLWLAGVALHNGQNRSLGECVLDFSCCHPDLSTSPDEKIKHVLGKLKESLVEEMRSREPGDGEEVDIEQQEFFVRTVERWFDDLVFDTCTKR